MPQGGPDMVEIIRNHTVLPAVDRNHIRRVFSSMLGRHGCRGSVRSGQGGEVSGRNNPDSQSDGLALKVSFSYLPSSTLKRDGVMTSPLHVFCRVRIISTLSGFYFRKTLMETCHSSIACCDFVLLGLVSRAGDNWRG